MSWLDTPNYRTIGVRIEAALRKSGPMGTPEILKRLRVSYSEAAIRTALRFLVDDCRIRRPSQKQRWELVAQVR